jgi:hypothetical protein
MTDDPRQDDRENPPVWTIAGARAALEAARPVAARHRVELARGDTDTERRLRDKARQIAGIDPDDLEDHDTPTPE